MNPDDLIKMGDLTMTADNKNNAGNPTLPTMFKVGDEVREISSGRFGVVQEVITSNLAGHEEKTAIACRFDDGGTAQVFVFDASELTPATPANAA